MANALGGVLEGRAALTGGTLAGVVITHGTLGGSVGACSVRHGGDGEHGGDGGDSGGMGAWIGAGSGLHSVSEKKGNSNTRIRERKKRRKKIILSILVFKYWWRSDFKTNKYGVCTIKLWLIISQLIKNEKADRKRI